MKLVSLAAIARRLRKRWLLAAIAHQFRVQRQADFDFERASLNREFIKRLAEIRVREVKSELAVMGDFDAA